MRSYRSATPEKKGAAAWSPFSALKDGAASQSIGANARTVKSKQAVFGTLMLAQPLLATRMNASSRSGFNEGA